MSENLLRHETSPYLLQHKDNPVHWRAWGAAAFEEAERLDKPILLSVGYAACHWCHVMAHESFENPEIAGIMNDLYVNIKVDREERPDIDQVYMAALHATGERGGWPLTMFLTPRREPFWGGTYFPPAPRFGRPGFGDVLRQVARAYREEPGKILKNVEAMARQSRPSGQPTGAIDASLLDDAAARLLGALDPVNGGFSGAPKFPQASLLEFLGRAGGGADDRFNAAFDLALTRISNGGIYDHVGGGFARYSVDERWHVPHFEKMLYDNAQILRLLTWAWRRSGKPLFKQRVEETIEWLAREMRVDGAFAASLDADSEGVEGKFYVWTLVELESVLGLDDAALIADIYGATRDGNWEHANVLHRLDPPGRSGDVTEAELAPLRRRLLDARATRVRPGRDDKALADWNGLMIGALAQAAVVFDRADWLVLARDAYRFVMDHMTRGDRVGHSARLGRFTFPGLSSDAACMIAAALALYEATTREEFLVDARRMTRALDAHHWDESVGYFLSADDSADLHVRPSGAQDDATPNPNAVMAGNLVRLGLLDGDHDYLDRAERLFTIHGGSIARNPFAHLGMMSAFDLAAKAVEVVIVGPIDGSANLFKAACSNGDPNLVITRVEAGANLSPSHPAHGRRMRDGKPTAYVCKSGACSLPVVSVDALRELLPA